MNPQFEDIIIVSGFFIIIYIVETNSLNTELWG